MSAPSQEVRGRHQPPATATDRRSRPSSSRSPRSTTTARSPAPTARSATCASATASSASCAPPRSATGPSPRRRRTSSSPRTRRALHVPVRPRRDDARLGSGRSLGRTVHRVRRTRLRGGRGRRSYQAVLADPTDGPLASAWTSSTARAARPARDQRRRQGRGRGAGRHQRRRPRHLRARAPRARAERLRGALPVPRRRTRRTSSSRPTPRATSPSSRRPSSGMTGYRRERAHRQALRDDRRLGGACRSPATAGRRSSTDPDAEVQAALILRGRDGRRTPVDVRAVGVVGRRRVRRDPGRHPRRERPGPPRARAAPPGRGAGRRRGAGPPRPRAARLGHPGAVLDDPRVALDRDAARDATRTRRATQLGQLRELQREALAEMRALIFELRPGNLEQDGLVRALKTHTRRAAGPARAAGRGRERPRRTGCRWRPRRCSTASPRRRSTTSSSTPAPRQVRVEVRQRDGGVRLRVEDDGKGFDPTTVPDGHLGLAGMRARADRVGASFVVPRASRARARRSRSASGRRRWPQRLQPRGGDRGPAPTPRRRDPVDPRRMT